MKIKVEVEREKDGRWIAEIPQLPGCLIYGKTPKDALDKVKTLAVQVFKESSASWTIKEQRGLLRQLLSAIKRAESRFIFHNGEGIGPKMLSRIAKRTGLKPEDL